MFLLKFLLFNCSESQTESRYLVELLNKEYQWHSRIERIISPSTNLDIVETKERKETDKQLALMPCNCLVNRVCSELQEADCDPIHGYQHLPVVSLEEAVENIIPLVPGIVECVSIAKKKCNLSSTLLTRDESAAIYLYSMPTPFFTRLNEAFRARSSHVVKPWLTFLKLFMSALEKLPSIKTTVWRGVSGDVRSNFNDGDVHIWWSINSCSADIKVIERYLDNTSTVFAIDTIKGKDISMFSAFPDEREIILMPGTRMRIKAKSLTFKLRCFLVNLAEENEQRLVHNHAN